MTTCEEHLPSNRNAAFRQAKKAARAKLTNYEKLEKWLGKLRAKDAVGVFMAPADITRFEDNGGNALCLCQGQLVAQRRESGQLTCAEHGTVIWGDGTAMAGQ